METTAVRLYGANDLRLEVFPLPKIGHDEILAKVIANGLCTSSYKATKLGAEHIRVPDDVSDTPIIVGHEFCGELVEIGDRWKDRYRVGDRFVVQPAMKYKDGLVAPGYSYPHIGGNATYVIIPREVIEEDCLLGYQGDSFFAGSVAEPLSCIVGNFKLMHHLDKASYRFQSGIKQDGNLLLAGGAGGMGLGMIEYAVCGDVRPALIVVTDVDQSKIDHAAKVFNAEELERKGTRLVFRNVRGDSAEVKRDLIALSGGRGFDDILLMAAVRPAIAMADELLAIDGCLNLFAGPTDKQFKAEINFYNVHYRSTHYVGASGGNSEDMVGYLRLVSAGRLNPAVVISHIGGLNSVVDALLRFQELPGAKKLIYTHIRMDLTAIEEFAELGRGNPLYRELADRVDAHGGLWNKEAEDYLLKHGDRI